MNQDIPAQIPEGMTALQYRIAILDAFLTRKPWSDVLQTSRNQKVDVEWIATHTYYLSDGGYSRLCIRIPDCENNIPVFLDSVSSDKAKENWQHCKELIRDVKAAAREEYRILGWIEEEEQRAKDAATGNLNAHLGYPED